MEKIKGFERYQRQVILKGFGESGQLKLQQAKVLVVGAGGLGCPALQYLAAAGVGTIGIVDGDEVSASNLHRQVLYGVKDIGKPKVEVATAAIQSLNPDGKVNAHHIRINQHNCLDIINGYDIVVDCTDNFATRYMLNDACVLKGIPLVHGSVSRFEGQVSVFNVKLKNGKYSGHYRDLFPTPPMAGEVPDCSEAGVLGVLPGIIGTMQASETIKWITGIGDLLMDKLMTYDALHNRFMELRYEHSESTAKFHPVHETEFMDTDYEQACGTGNDGFMISGVDFETLKRREVVQVIDVRESNEVPTLDEYNHVRIPLGKLKSLLFTIKPSTMVFFCQSGIRSLTAARIASEHFGKKVKVFSLKDGITHFISSPKTIEF